jgi:hypothetical protein
MVGISGNCRKQFETDGPSMLVGATPSRSSIRSHSKYNHPGKARKVDSSLDGVASLVDYCAADLLLFVTPPQPRTSLQTLRPLSLFCNSALQVRLLTHAIPVTEFTRRAFGGIL